MKRLISIIGQWSEDSEYNLYDELYKKRDSWNNAIPPGGAFVNAVLAFDVIYDDIPSIADRTRLENALGKVAKHYYDVPEGHTVGIITVPGTWALFQRNYELARECYDEYLLHFDPYMTEDGVGVIASSYANSRFMSNTSNSKLIMPLIMDYTGQDTTFFKNPKYIKFAEWLLGYTYAPSTERWIIGDTDPADIPGSKNFLQYWGWKYSKTAGETGAWMHYQSSAGGELLSYLTTPEEFPEPKMPTSRIFKDGGAYFYENYDTSNSIAGLLWNPTITDGHAHKETNAVLTYAYGEMLTANAGYFGWGKGYNGYTWDYINNRAISANTVLVNYNYGDIKNPSAENDHATKTGDGIKQGFTATLLDYARGVSGKAIGNAEHERSFVMIKTQDGAPGYFAVLDDVRGHSSKDVVTTVHRPMSANVSEISKDTEYVWNIKRKTATGVDFTVFLATEPTEVVVEDGVVATQGLTSSIPIKTLLNKYEMGDSLHKRIGTLLIPSDESHIKPEIQRISTNSITGAKLIFNNNIEDYMLQPKNSKNCIYYIKDNSDTSTLSYDRVKFEADSLLFRKNQGALSWYFAENSKNVMIGQQGFTSEKQISIYLKGSSGKGFAAQETSAAIYEYGITGVKINGETTEIIDNGSGFVKVMLPEGEFEIELIIDSELKLSDFVSSKVANGRFDEMTVIDTLNNYVIFNGKRDSFEFEYVDDKIYISESDAIKMFGVSSANSRDINGIKFVALREYVENKGLSLLWHDTGIAIVSHGTLNQKADSPLIGFILRLCSRIKESWDIQRPVIANKIMINGEELNYFSPEKKEYLLRCNEDFKLADVEVISDFEAEVIYPSENENNLIINVTDGFFSTAYKIRILKAKEVVSVTASSVPQVDNVPENTLDGNLDTRWASEKEQWIMYDLGEVKQINGIELSWYLGYTRQQLFDVLLSADGNEWTTVFSGKNSGTTADLEEVPMEKTNARFVKIMCFGNTSTTWNSLTECVIK